MKPKSNPNKKQPQSPKQQPQSPDLMQREQELAQREQDLAERERTIRLQEMEMELYKQDPPLYQTTKHEQGESALRRWSRKMAMVGKFLVIVVAVAAAVRVGTWLAMAVIIGATAWIGYQLFFESEKTNH